jgi:two-component sensor histidine kinase
MDGEWLGSSRDRLVERPLSVIADYWAGVAEVTINGAESVYGASASSVFTVVEELVANSIRHGRARHVRVDITAGERTYLVVVADDGEASDVGPPGLGTSLMSRLGTRRHISDDSGWTVEVEVDHPG